jgi:hypothetical protein
MTAEIGNHRQREITVYWAERFAVALDQLGQSDMPYRLRTAQSLVLQSMIDDLNAEVAAYDARPVVSP